MEAVPPLAVLVTILAVTTGVALADPDAVPFAMALAAGLLVLLAARMVRRGRQ
jgi:hypothetical protein